jgi:hypothetical protein
MTGGFFQTSITADGVAAVAIINCGPLHGFGLMNILTTSTARVEMPTKLTFVWKMFTCSKQTKNALKIITTMHSVFNSIGHTSDIR